MRKERMTKYYAVLGLFIIVLFTDNPDYLLVGGVVGGIIGYHLWG